MASARGGLDSINIDLIYGLPLQTMESFARTVGRSMRPGPTAARYAYAHLPERFQPQRRIAAAQLPPRLERCRCCRTREGGPFLAYLQANRNRARFSRII